VLVLHDPTSINFCFEGKFENGVAEGMVDPRLNPISAFRLSVIQNSAVWAILNEVRMN
jgi:alpha-1,3-mannosylglycoprotein beta-1,4-N-acetylglucosaminyltransferase A/B